MTLNASWIERLTLRGQVIRETKGQAKQQEKTPNYSYYTPLPPFREGLQMLAGSAPTNTRLPMIPLTLQSSVSDSAEQDAPKLERNEASG